jgi:N6-L-threonylcarbamoyladenine synthase
MGAARELGRDTIAIAGGVAANSRIRADLESAARAGGRRLYMPPLSLCGDNAAMIGCQGYYEYLAGVRAGMSLNAYPSLSIDNEGYAARRKLKLFIERKYCGYGDGLGEQYK